MGISRQTALRRIRGLRVQVEAHRAKIRRKEPRDSIRHWTVEVESWLAQIERLSAHVGERSRREILKQVEEWRRELEAADE